MESVEYYNQESNKYSQKRYPEAINDYLPYFFNKRFEIAKRFIKKVMKNGDILLEIGCADGVILTKIYRAFEGRFFKKLIGIDNAPFMIEAAKRKTDLKEIEFCIRDQWNPDEKTDIVLEIGVFNFTKLSDEITFASSNLKENGFYICSVAGKKSLRNSFKNEGARFFNFLTFAEYEKEFSKKFDILESQRFGLYLPLVWKNKNIGRIIQPILDKIFFFFPDYYHEAIYLMKKK